MIRRSLFFQRIQSTVRFLTDFPSRPIPRIRLVVKVFRSVMVTPGFSAPCTRARYWPFGESWAALIAGASKISARRRLPGGSTGFGPAAPATAGSHAVQRQRRTRNWRTQAPLRCNYRRSLGSSGVRVNVATKIRAETSHRTLADHVLGKLPAVSLSGARRKPHDAVAAPCASARPQNAINTPKWGCAGRSAGRILATSSSRAGQIAQSAFADKLES